MKKYTKMITAAITALLVTVVLATGCAPAAQDVTQESQAEQIYDTNPSLAEKDSAVPQEAAEAEDAEMSREEPMFGEPQDEGHDVVESRRYDNSSEEYGEFVENGYKSPLEDPLSTFSIDVDTASYSNIRRYLNDGSLPPKDTVRIEECINYFDYDYNNPFGADPIGIGVTISDCPWNSDRYLARISVKAKELDLSEAPESNLVFLLDVSGSMDNPDKLPLVKSALIMLTDSLSNNDSVSIVVYAGASGLVLDGCKGEDKMSIERALEHLQAGGSTAGGEGINLAYQIAEKNFIRNGNNRVILCTDGDFNVGVSSTDGLEDLIEEKRESGVFLSVLGFGEGNIKDNKMETLADKGNGNYAYIDSLIEAKKVLVNEMSSTLFTAAKDVKIQIEFNPKAILEYRLVGYDNRMLNPEDFNDDKKDAGEMGAGHTVTAFYELILVGSAGSGNVDDLVFQENPEFKKYAEPAEEWLYVKARYKKPDEHESKLLAIISGIKNYTKNPDSDFQFASAVAEFAMLLKDSDYAQDASFTDLIDRAKGSKGYDENGYRAQFIQLAELASMLRR